MESGRAGGGLAPRRRSTSQASQDPGGGVAAKRCVVTRKLRDPKRQRPSEAKPGLDIAQIVFVGDDARGFVFGGSFHALDFESLCEGTILTTQSNIFGLKDNEFDDEEE